MARLRGGLGVSQGEPPGLACNNTPGSLSMPPAGGHPEQLRPLLQQSLAPRFSFQQPFLATPRQSALLQIGVLRVWFWRLRVSNPS